MTRDRLHGLLLHCADLGIEVEWHDLGDHLRGDYCRESSTIRLNRRLTHVQTVATCGHELAHAMLGDECSTPAVERRAWELAAAMLIEPHEYETAERLVGHHLAALALELGVTPILVEAWRRWYLKRYPIELRRY